MALSLQNGIGNLEQMAEFVGLERLLAGVIIAGVTLLDWGRIRPAGQGPIILGIPPGSQVRPAELQSLLGLFNQAGFVCREAGDIIGALWDKLMLNIGINPLTALIRVANGDLLTVPEAWDLAAAAVQEGAAVARALNITLSADPLARLRQVCQATAANHSSMLQDVLAGRPTEIAALNGQIVTKGQDRGIPTPINAILTQLIRAVEQSYPHRARLSANPLRA
jgi:2-dehydropantoate 2-reductase